jgi:hypothetical protein
MKKISEKKIKKAEEEITRVVNDLFKDFRGVEWIDPDVTIHLHGFNNPLHRRIYHKIDAFMHPDSKTKILSPDSSKEYYCQSLTIYLHS